MPFEYDLNTCIDYEEPAIAFLSEMRLECMSNPGVKLLNKTESEAVATEQGIEVHEVEGSYPKYIHQATIFLGQTPKIKLPPVSTFATLYFGEAVVFAEHGLYKCKKDGTDGRPILGKSKIKALIRSDKIYWDKVLNARTLQEEVSKRYVCPSVARFREIIQDIGPQNLVPPGYYGNINAQLQNSNNGTASIHNTNHGGRHVRFASTGQVLTNTHEAQVFQGSNHNDLGNHNGGGHVRSASTGAVLTRTQKADTIAEYFAIAREVNETMQNYVSSNKLICLVSFLFLPAH